MPTFACTVPYISPCHSLSTDYFGHRIQFEPPNSRGANRQSFLLPVVALHRSLTSVLIGIVLATNVSVPATFFDLPRTLSGEDKGSKIQKPKSTRAESCTIKCVGSCTRGGEGPLNIRRPLVVFKDGFRSRQYCLIECSDICNLIKDGDEGP